MLHKMNLRPGPFACIQSGQKDVELRLHDEKRQLIQAGDTVEFTNTVTGEVLQAKVAKKSVYPDFAELYRHYDKLRMGYAPEDIADPKDMELYYPAEKIARFGVAAIELKEVKVCTLSNI